jgi:hypothetical protein
MELLKTISEAGVVLVADENMDKIGKRECKIALGLLFVSVIVGVFSSNYFAVVPGLLGSVYLYRRGANWINEAEKLGVGDGKIPSL